MLLLLNYMNRMHVSFLYRLFIYIYITGGDLDIVQGAFAKVVLLFPNTEPICLPASVIFIYLDTFLFVVFFYYLYSNLMFFFQCNC